MSEHSISLEQALNAQKAMREAAGAEPEVFPLEAFVGMISDEVDMLRSSGKTDEDIVSLIEKGSGIQITADELRANYASPELRHPRD